MIPLLIKVAICILAALSIASFLNIKARKDVDALTSTLSFLLLIAGLIASAIFWMQISQFSKETERLFLP